MVVMSEVETFAITKVEYARHGTEVRIPNSALLGGQGLCAAILRLSSAAILMGREKART